MKHTCQELVDNVLDAVCGTAETIERFETKKGCTRICFYPSHSVANAWWGGFRFRSDFIPDLEVSYPILPGGDRLAVFDEKDTETGELVTVEVDTYAITAGKIAAISRYQEEGVLQSGIGKLRQLLMENGLAPWKGAVAFELYEVSGDNEIPFGGLYVSVSGGSENEDHLCASSAIPVVSSFFGAEGMKVVMPVIDRELLGQIVAEEKEET